MIKKRKHTKDNSAGLKLQDVRNRSGHLFELLQPDRAYSAKMIVDFAATEGLLKKNGLSLTRRRSQLWAQLDLLAGVHRFPAQGDLLLVLSDLKPKPGWYGSRWMDAYRKSRARQLAAATDRVKLHDVGNESGHLFDFLQLNRVYSSKRIVNIAITRNLLKKNGMSLARRRVQLWVTLDLFTAVHRFPAQGDSRLLSPDLKQTPGWYGSRWLDAYRKQLGPVKQLKRRGRKKLYKNEICLLNDHTCYSAADVAAFILEHLYAHLPKEEQQRLYQRIRVTLGSYKRRYNFPREGDRLIISQGRPPRPGYWGKRWKDIYAEQKKRPAVVIRPKRLPAR